MATTAERVAAAARATLGAGSARVWECRFAEPLGPPERSTTEYAEGVADLANVRAQVWETEARLLKEVGDRILERWPWLAGDEDEEYDDEFAPTIVYAGTAGDLGNGDNWMPLGLRAGDPHAGRRSGNDPLWILEALTSVADAAPRAPAPEIVRDAPCNRLRVEIDLRRSDAALEERERQRRSHRVTGDVWIDGRERIRRVTWQRPILHRARSPLAIPHRTHWRTLELWDFGIPVDIAIPTLMEPPPKRPLLRDLYDGVGWLWRRKRAYDRRR